MKALWVVGLGVLASTAHADRAVDLTFSPEVRTVNLVSGLVSHYGETIGFSADYDLVVTAPGPTTLPPFTEHGTVAKTFGDSRWEWGSYIVASIGTSMIRVDTARQQYIETQTSALLDGVLAFSEPGTFADRYDVTSPSDLQLVLTPRGHGTVVDHIVIAVDPIAHGRVAGVTVYDNTGAMNDFTFSDEQIADVRSGTFSRATLAGYRRVKTPLPLPTTRTDR